MSLSPAIHQQSQGQRPLTKIYSETKNRCHVQATPDASSDTASIQRRFKIQEHRLLAWGHEWRDSNAAEAEIDSTCEEEGVFDLVRSILISIMSIWPGESLDADSPSEKRVYSKGSREKAYFSAGDVRPRRRLMENEYTEERLRDLTTAVDTLYELSASRRALRDSSSKKQPLVPSRDFKIDYIEDEAEGPKVESSRLETSLRMDPSCLIGPKETFGPPPYRYALGGQEPPSEVLAHTEESRVISQLRQPNTSTNPWKRDGGIVPTEPVLVEYSSWDSVYSSTMNYIPTDRLDTLAKFLHRPTGKPHHPQLRVLNLLGYFEDLSKNRYGLVYEIPHSSEHGPFHSKSNLDFLKPTTLLTLLESNALSVPLLEDRMRLSYNLALTFWHLLATTTHQDVTSNNILFFPIPRTRVIQGSDDTVRYDLRSPYLSSFDVFSKYDLETRKDPNLFHIYRHPQDQRLPDELRDGDKAEYRTQFDMYSLGLILLEVGLWMPLKSFWKTKYNVPMFRDRIERIYVRKLGEKCGSLYMKATATCLALGSAPVDTDLLMRFHRDVVKPLEQYCALDTRPSSPPMYQSIESWATNIPKAETSSLISTHSSPALPAYAALQSQSQSTPEKSLPTSKSVETLSSDMQSLMSSMYQTETSMTSYSDRTTQRSRHLKPIDPPRSRSESLSSLKNAATFEAKDFVLPPPPDAEVVEQQFRQMIQRLGGNDLPQQAWQQMLSLPIEKKWARICGEKLMDLSSLPLSSDLLSNSSTRKESFGGVPLDTPARPKTHSRNLTYDLYGISHDIGKQDSKGLSVPATDSASQMSESPAEVRSSQSFHQDSGRPDVEATTTVEQEPGIKRKLRVHPASLTPEKLKEWHADVLPRLERVLSKILADSNETVSIDLLGVGSNDEKKNVVFVTCTSTKRVKAKLNRYFAAKPIDYEVRVRQGKVQRSSGRHIRRANGGGRHIGPDGQWIYDARMPRHQERPMCGASLGAKKGDYFLPPVTYGGVLQVEDKMFGMTVHHLLDMPSDAEDDEPPTTRSSAGAHWRSQAPREPYQHPNAADYQRDMDLLCGGVTDSEDEDEEMPDLDSDDSDVNSVVSDSEEEDLTKFGDIDGYVAGAPHEIIITQPAYEDVPDDCLSGPDEVDEMKHLNEHKLGSLYASSGVRRLTLPSEDGRSVVHEIDWALVKVDEDRMHPMNVVLGGKQYCRSRHHHGYSCLPSAKSKLRTFYPPEQDLFTTEVVPTKELAQLEVHAFGRTSGLAPGKISAAMSSVKIHGRKTFSQLWHIIGGFGQGGDSGAWIIDNHEGRVCGHVLAYCSRNRITYFIPMEILINDIKDTLKTDNVKLPGVEMMHKWDPRKRASVSTPKLPMSSPINIPTRPRSFSPASLSPQMRWMPEQNNSRDGSLMAPSSSRHNRRSQSPVPPASAQTALSYVEVSALAGTRPATSAASSTRSISSSSAEHDRDAGPCPAAQAQSRAQPQALSSSPSPPTTELEAMKIDGTQNAMQAENKAQVQNGGVVAGVQVHVGTA